MFIETTTHVAVLYTDGQITIGELYRSTHVIDGTDEVVFILEDGMYRYREFYLDEHVYEGELFFKKKARVFEKYNYDLIEWEERRDMSVLVLFKSEHKDEAIKHLQEVHNEQTH